MTVYEIVKAKAEQANETIASLERKADIANGTIAGWKTGRPYAETLKKVADVLECKIEELMPD